MADGFFDAPTLPSDYQAHHSIPQALWPKNETLKALIAAGKITTGDPGASGVLSLADFTKNGIGLPDNAGGALQTGLSEHSGSHPRYSAFINRLLDEASRGIDLPTASSAELDLITSRVEKIMAFSQTLNAGLQSGGAAALNAVDPRVPGYPNLSANQELKAKRAWVAGNWDTMATNAIAGGIDNLIDMQLYEQYRAKGVFDPVISAADRAIRVRDAQAAALPGLEARRNEAVANNAPATTISRLNHTLNIALLGVGIYEAIKAFNSGDTEGAQTASVTMMLPAIGQLGLDVGVKSAQSVAKDLAPFMTKGAGAIGVLLALVPAIYEARSAIQAGDIDKARSIIEPALAGVAGALLTVAAAALLATALAPLTPVLLGATASAVLTFVANVGLAIAGDTLGRMLYDRGGDILNRLLSSSFTPRNPNIFNLSTDPVGLRPSNIDFLGGIAANQGLLANGAGWAATMPTPFVQNGGGQFAGPSALAAGGTRPGNSTESSMGNLVNSIRRLSGDLDLPPVGPIGNLSLSGGQGNAGTFFPEGVHSTNLYLTLNGVRSDSFSGTVRYDAQGNVVAVTPDNGKITFRNPDGTISSKSFDVTTDISWQFTSQPTVNADGSWQASGWSYSSNTDIGAQVLADAGYKDAAYTDPLVLDGTNDGIVLSPPGASPNFDLNGDGASDAVAWPGPTDGMIVRDVDSDGRISSGTELFSVFGNSGQPSLASQDSDGDGILDAKDGNWEQLQIWTDRNRDGYASPGELQSLADAGIVSINLTPVSGTVAGQSNVKGVVATLADGSQRTLWDVAFTQAQAPAMTRSYYSSGIDKVTGAGQTALVAYSGLGVTIDLNGSGAAQAIGAAGDDVLIGTGGNDWLTGGAGADRFLAGAGDDLLVIDADDRQGDIDGGAGIDSVVVSDDRGVALNLFQANVEVVYGGYGDDVFVGGGADNYFIDGAAGDDLIIGGSADDVLSGQDGNDIISGGDGNDLIRGGRGDDHLDGGNGNDVIDGGLGNDIIDGGAGNDVFIASGGDDTIDGGDGIDLIQLSGALSDYSFERLSDGSYRITDHVADRDGSEIIKNIEKFSFKTGLGNTAIDIGLNAPLPVDDRIAVPDGGSMTIAVAALIANDVDFQHLGAPQLSLSWVGDAVGGTVALSADGQSVIFTRNAGYLGPMEFSYRVRDEQGNTGPTIVTATDPAIQGEMKARVLLVSSDAPTDPDFARQWYLGAIRAPQAWQAGYTGKGVKVLVFEPSGPFATTRQVADLNHPDLVANQNSSFQDTPGHSAHATEVAGVIGAARNGIGGVGVAYGVTLDSRTFAPVDRTIGSFRDDLSVMQRYDVINNSWTQGDPDQFGWLASAAAGDPAITLQIGAVGEAITTAATYGRGGLGTVMVFAAGNSRSRGDDAGLSTMDNNEFTITVGGINLVGDIGGSVQPVSPFSERGTNILVSAPASNIVTTGMTVVTDDGTTVGSATSEAQGTSLAAPIVSGVIALMLEANPKLTYRDVQTILALTARQDLGTGTAAATNWSTNHDTVWNGTGMHYSADFGFGIVDAAAAVRMAETWISEGNAPAQTVVASATAGALPDAGTSPGQQTLTFDVTGNVIAEQAVLHLSLDHPRWSDLVVTLISPSGTRSILLDRPGAAGSVANPTGSITFEVNLMSVQFRGESANGTWQLVVEDAAPGAAASGGIAASLRVVGTAADAGRQHVFTDEYAGGATIVAATASDVFNAAAVSGSSVIDLRAGTTSSVNGKSVAVSSNLLGGFGGEGNDTLIGSAGSNTLGGGHGNDTLIGNGGNDTYMFSPHDGQDVVINGLASNGDPAGQLLLETGFDLNKLWLTQSGNDLLVQVLGTTQQITIKNWFANSYSELQSFLLDSRTKTAKAITAGITDLARAMTAYQLAHPGFNAQSQAQMPDDPAVAAALNRDWVITVVGTSGNDTLDGGLGNATLIGMGGQDTYIFNAGYGHDVIYNGDPFFWDHASHSVPASGRLQLGGGLAPNNLWLALSGNDLIITVLGTDSGVTIKNWAAMLSHNGITPVVNQVGELQYLTLADGSQISTDAIAGLAAEMNIYQASHPSFNPVTAAEMPGDARLTGALNTYWTRVITSTGNNERLAGVFGNDTIIANGIGDVLNGGAGVSTLISNGAGNTLQKSTGSTIVEYVGDGMTVNLSTGTARVNGSTASDTLIGITNVVLAGKNDFAVGGNGTDTLSALGTDDTLRGGSGTSTLISEINGNTIIGGSGKTVFIAHASTTNISNAVVDLTAGTASGTRYLQDAAGHLNIVHPSDTLIGISVAMAVDYSETITSSNNGNTLIAAGFYETLIAAGSNDVLIAQGQYSGHNTLWASGSGDTLIATSDQHVLLGTGVGDTLISSGRTNTLTVSGTHDAVLASGADNWLIAEGDASTLIAASPNETLVGNLGSNTLIGSSATDILRYVANEATVNLQTGLATRNGASAGETLVNLSNVSIVGDSNTLIAGGQRTLAASGNADTLVVTGNGSVLTALGANDRLNATGDRNTLIASGSNGALFVSGSSNTLSASGAHMTLDAIGSGNTLLGGHETETLLGHASGNTLVTGTGRTSAYFDVGGVTVNLAAGTAKINGSSASDTLIGLTRATVSGDNATLIGTAGFNTLSALGSNDTVIAGYGVDTLIAASQDTLIAVNGSATLVATGSGNKLYGGSGTSTLIGLSGGNLLLGGSGPATLMGGAVGNTLVAGTGVAVAAYSQDAITVDLSAGTAKVNGASVGDTLIGISAVIAGGAGDTLTTSRNDSTLIATGASDTLIANAGRDALIALGSHVTLTASGQHDTLLAYGDDETIISSGTYNTMVAWGNNDTLIALGDLSTLVAFGTHDVLIGLGRENLLEDFGRRTTLVSNGNGNTLLSGAGPTVVSYHGDGLTVDLSAGSGGTNGSGAADTLLGIVAVSMAGNANTLIGGSAKDTLAATGTGNTLIGGSGENTLSVAGTGNLLVGGSGTTTLMGGLAGNTLVSGSGKSVAAYSAEHITVDLAAGRAAANTSDGCDTLLGVHVVEVDGAVNTLIGRASGGDTLIATHGAGDTLIALGVGTTLDVESGAATLVSSGGGNWLRSGDKQATAYYGGSDIIVDMGAGTAKKSGSTLGDTLVGINAAVVAGTRDTLIGNAANNVLTSFGSGNMLVGGTGSSTLVSNGAGNTLKAGTGNTTALYTGNGVAINLAANTARVNGSAASDTLIGINRVVAAGTNDTLIGGSALSTFVSNAAGNTLVAGTNSVALYDIDNLVVDLKSGIAGVSGRGTGDTLLGGFVLEALGSNNTLTGNMTGNGTITSTLISGINNNTLIYAGYAILLGDGIFVDVGAGKASNQKGLTNTLIGNSSIELSGNDNTMVSGNGSHFLDAGAGNHNTLITSSYTSNNTLLAGSGNDNTLIASAENTWGNVLKGGDGISTLIGSSTPTPYESNTLIAGRGPTVASYEADGIIVDLKTGGAGISGWANWDTLVGISIAQATGAHQTLVGGATSSTLMSNGNGNTLIGAVSGTQAYYSADGVVIDLLYNTATTRTNPWVHDTLAGIDIVKAGGSHDTLIAGASTYTWGKDTLIGGREISTLISAPSGNTLIAGAGPTVASYGYYGYESNYWGYDAYPGDFSYSYKGYDASGGSSGHGVVVNLATGTATGGIFKVFDEFHGVWVSPLNTYVDTLINISIAQALAANETLIGGSSRSTLLSNGRDNTLIAGSGGAVARYEAENGGNDLSIFLPSTTGALGRTTYKFDSAKDVLIGINEADISGANNSIACQNVGQVAVSTGSHNFLRGLFQNDTLISSGYYDTLFGGLKLGTLIRGSNTLISSGIYAVLRGYGQDNTLISSGDNAVMYAAAADKLISSGAGAVMYADVANTVISSGSNARLFSNANDVFISSGANATLFGHLGSNTLISSNGDAVASYSATSGLVIDLDAGVAKDASGHSDTLIGINDIDVVGGGNNTLIAHSGAMKIAASPADNTLVGSLGRTKVSYRTTKTGVVLDIGAQLIFLNGARDVLIGISRAELWGNLNALIGASGVDEISAFGNSNTLIAGSGAEYLASSGQGNTLIGGSGSSTLTSRGGGNTLIGGSGLTTLRSGGSSNTLIAGRGRTVAEITGTGEIVNLVVGEFQGTDMLIGINIVIAGGLGETLIGGSGADTLIASGVANTLIGKAGAEQLSATGTGNTLIDASGTGTLMSSGQGNTLVGGLDRDTLFSSGTQDTLLSINGANLLLSTGRGNTLLGGIGADTLVSFGIDDRLFAQTSLNTLVAKGARDTLVGNMSGATLMSSGGLEAMAFYEMSGAYINLAQGTATVSGVATADRLIGVSIAAVQGKSNTLIGGSGGSTLIDRTSLNRGDSFYGRNTLMAGDGSSVLLDSRLLDQQSVHSGDVLIAGSGNNTLIDSRTFSSDLDYYDGVYVGDTLIGGSGTDTLVANRSYGKLLQLAGDTLIAGTGKTVVYYVGDGARVGLSSGQASHNNQWGDDDRLIGITNAIVAGNDAWLSGTSAGHNFLAAASGQNVRIDSQGSSNTLLGGSGQTTLLARGTGDTLIAGTGVTIMTDVGAAGHYEYDAGAGQAMIINGSSGQAAASNELDFGSGITDERLWFRRTGNNLQIDLLGGTSEVIVRDWFAATGNQLAEITAGGLKLDSSVAQLVQAMAVYSATHPDFNPTSVAQAPNDPALQSAIAAAWHS